MKSVDAGGNFRAREPRHVVCRVLTARGAVLPQGSAG